MNVLAAGYPSRSGYEAGGGGQGMAYSKDGVTWDRISSTTPVIAKGHPKDPKWEDGTVYQPYLVQHNGTYYDFYNAAGINEFGNNAEETGFSTLTAKEGLPGINFSTNRSQWQVNAASPVIPSGKAGATDNSMASDPKLYWDEVSLTAASFESSSLRCPLFSFPFRSRTIFLQSRPSQVRMISSASHGM